MQAASTKIGLNRSGGILLPLPGINISGRGKGEAITMYRQGEFVDLCARIFANLCRAREALAEKGIEADVLKLNRIKPIDPQAVQLARGIPALLDEQEISFTYK